MNSSDFLCFQCLVSSCSCGSQWQGVFPPFPPQFRSFVCPLAPKISSAWCAWLIIWGRRLVADPRSENSVDGASKPMKPQPFPVALHFGRGIERERETQCNDNHPSQPAQTSMIGNLKTRNSHSHTVPSDETRQLP